MSQKLLSVREVCQQYGLSDRTVRRFLKDGTLTGYRVGKRLIKLDSAEVDVALKQPAESSIERAVARIVAEAPPLNDEQRERISALLRSDRQTAVEQRLREMGGGPDVA